MPDPTLALSDKDMQVMQLIAEAAASRAVEKQTSALRHDMRSMAESTAEIMATRISSQLMERMREMESRLRDDLGDRMENAIKENVGMSRDDHVQQHRQISEVIDGYKSVNRTIWSSIIKTVAVVGLAGWLGSAAKDMPPILSSHTERGAAHQELRTPQ